MSEVEGTQTVRLEVLRPVGFEEFFLRSAFTRLCVEGCVSYLSLTFSFLFPVSDSAFAWLIILIKVSWGTINLLFRALHKKTSCWNFVGPSTRGQKQVSTQAISDGGTNTSPGVLTWNLNMIIRDHCDVTKGRYLQAALTCFRGVNRPTRDSTVREHCLSERAEIQTHTPSIPNGTRQGTFNDARSKHPAAQMSKKQNKQTLLLFFLDWNVYEGVREACKHRASSSKDPHLHSDTWLLIFFSWCFSFLSA